MPEVSATVSPLATIHDPAASPQSILDHPFHDGELARISDRPHGCICVDALSDPDCPHVGQEIFQEYLVDRVLNKDPADAETDQASVPALEGGGHPGSCLDISIGKDNNWR